jgi:hypothetical protein
MEFITEKDLAYFYSIDWRRNIGRYMEVFSQNDVLIDEVQAIRWGSCQQTTIGLLRCISWSI